MRPKALLFDLDNTLYEYAPANEAGKKNLFKEIHSLTETPTGEIENAYADARKEINQNLKGTGSSHSRLLYLQRTLETLGVTGYSRLIDLHNIFWKAYFENMKLRPGVIPFLEQNQLPLCIVTDFTAEKQFEKLMHLKVLKYFKLLVSSEEAGVEKPDARIFQTALNKLQLQASEVYMIGDDKTKDIDGANNCGISACWLTDMESPVSLNQNYRIFNDFTQLGVLISES